MISMNPAQRTNFKPSMPRLASKPGMERQVFPRSKNRGKKSEVAGNIVDTQQMLKKFAKFKAGAV